MAATMKLSLIFALLLSGLVVFGEARHPTANCDAIQCIQGGNVTCENHEEAIQACVCLCAPKNGKRCVLRLHDGTKQNCTNMHY